MEEEEEDLAVRDSRRRGLAASGHNYDHTTSVRFRFNSKLKFPLAFTRPSSSLHSTPFIPPIHGEHRSEYRCSDDGSCCPPT